MIIKNLTPHSVNYISEEDIIISIEPEKTPARCFQSIVSDGTLKTAIGNFNLSKSKFGKVENIPEQEDGVYYIVSRLVLSACADRNDLLVPNEIVRNDSGQIIGCKSFSID